MPVLHLLAGPNGAGKSSYVHDVLAPVTHLPFINADVIAAQRWPDTQLEHAYEAARIAERLRRELHRREAIIHFRDRCSRTPVRSSWSLMLPMPDSSSHCTSSWFPSTSRFSECASVCVAGGTQCRSARIPGEI